MCCPFNFCFVFSFADDNFCSSFHFSVVQIVILMTIYLLDGRPTECLEKNISFRVLFQQLFWSESFCLVHIFHLASDLEKEHLQVFQYLWWFSFWIDLSIGLMQ